MKSIFKHSVIFILLAAFVMQLFSNTIIYATFLIHQDYIAENLCIDKDIKESTCEGKCHLKEELKKSNQEKEKPLMSFNDKQEIVFCSCDQSSFDQNLVFEEKNLPCVYLMSFSQPHLHQLFVPPRV